LKPQSSKDGGIDEAEGAFKIRGLITTFQLTLTTSHYPHKLIAVFAKDA